MDILARLNWSDLRVILAIREHGGAANAGAALGLSHQTISRRLTRLEQTLGLRLVNRERHPWVLTEKGRAICNHAAGMEMAAHDVVDYAINARPDKIDRITIASNTWGFDLLVFPVLKSLRRAYPALAFDFISGDDPLDVQSGKADLAIRFTDTPPPDLIGRRIGPLSMGVFGVRGLIDLLDSQRTNDVPVIIHTGVQQHKNAWPAQTRDFQSTIAVNDFSTLVSAVRFEFGVAAMPKIVGLSCAELVASRTVTLKPQRSVWLLRNEDSRGSKIVRSIEDKIFTYAGQILGSTCR